MNEPKPLTVFAGPEGSGTTYLWKCFCHSNRIAIRANTWWTDHDRSVDPVQTAASLEGTKGRKPSLRLLHLSLPSLRPARWMDEIDHRIDAQNSRFVAVIRENRFAVRSTYRRFGKNRSTSHVEQRQFNQAISYIFGTLVENFETMIVQYTQLGDENTRSQLEAFVGMKADWLPFENKNV